MESEGGEGFRYGPNAQMRRFTLIIRGCCGEGGFQPAVNHCLRPATEKSDPFYASLPQPCRPANYTDSDNPPSLTGYCLSSRNDSYNTHRLSGLYKALSEINGSLEAHRPLGDAKIAQLSSALPACRDNPRFGPDHPKNLARAASHTRHTSFLLFNPLATSPRKIITTNTISIRSSPAD